MNFFSPRGFSRASIIEIKMTHYWMRHHRFVPHNFDSDQQQSHLTWASFSSVVWFNGVKIRLEEIEFKSKIRRKKNERQEMNGKVSEKDINCPLGNGSECFSWGNFNCFHQIFIWEYLPCGLQLWFLLELQCFCFRYKYLISTKIKHSTNRIKAETIHSHSVRPTNSPFSL